MLEHIFLIDTPAVRGAEKNILCTLNKFVIWNDSSSAYVWILIDISFSAQVRKAKIEITPTTPAFSLVQWGEENFAESYLESFFFSFSRHLSLLEKL